MTKDEIKVMLMIFGFVLCVATGAGVFGYLDGQQKIELAKVRCEK
jgi:hypothetical protein